MNVLEIVLSAFIALITGIFFLGLARKVIARIHWRYGPPLLQPVIDIIRLFSQRSFSHGLIFDLGMILSLSGSFLVILFIPVGPIVPFSGSGGLLVILYLMLLGPLGIALSGGEGANPNISIGISRKFILSLAYEVPLLLILLSLMTHYNSLSIAEMVSRQAEEGWALFSFPLFLSGIAYFLILPAILGIRPFEIAGAAQEISSGPMVEYGGKYLAFAHIEHALNEFIGIALFVALFLGGGDLFGIFGAAAGSPADGILQLFVFLVKMVLVFLTGLSIHAVFPRLRIEQAVRYLWLWPSLLAFAGIILVMTV